MAEDTDAEFDTKFQRQFNDRSEKEIQEILDGKDKQNTKKATEGALKALKQYISSKKLPKIDNLTDQLATILFSFYPAVKPINKNNEIYAVQTLKCMRAGLSRYFRAEKGWDIIKSDKFIKANEIFKGMCVDSKKKGKGLRRSTPKITQIDMEKISEYFNYDHMNKPDPKRLQRHMLFYIIYFFCHRGRENLYPMTQSTFRLVTEFDGTQYVMQDIDKADKNHGPDDTEETNQGRMYGNEGTILF